MLICFVFDSFVHTLYMEKLHVLLIHWSVIHSGVCDLLICFGSLRCEQMGRTCLYCKLDLHPFINAAFCRFSLAKQARRFRGIRNGLWVRWPLSVQPAILMSGWPLPRLVSNNAISPELGNSTGISLFCLLSILSALDIKLLLVNWFLQVSGLASSSWIIASFAVVRLVLAFLHYNYANLNTCLQSLLCCINII
jgi:hypothetical protein